MKGKLESQLYRSVFAAIALLLVVAAGLAATAAPASIHLRVEAGASGDAGLGGLVGPLAPGATGKTGGAQPVPTMETGKVILGETLKVDTSAALRDLEPVPYAPQEGAEEEEEAGQPPFVDKGERADQMVQNWFGPNTMPTPVVVFEGMGNINGFTPPDTNGDVGPYHYVQWVNNSIQVFNKAGASLFGPVNGSTIWSGFGGNCEFQGRGDPIVLYDSIANRWLLSQMAFPNVNTGPFHQCIAISAGGDPTGAYHRYDFLMSTAWLNDYPKFGVWPDAYYMTINNYINNSQFVGPSVVAFDRARMLQGQSATFQKFDLIPAAGHMLPADFDGRTLPPAGSPGIFASLLSPTSMGIWWYAVNWANPGLTTFTATSIPVAAFNPNLCNWALDCIPQPGTTQRVDGRADRLMYRLAYRNMGTYEAMVTTHNVDAELNNHAGIRWYEIRNPRTNPFLQQQGTYAPDAQHRWMGGMAMDRMGNIALGYSLSSATTFPSIFYTGRLVTDPQNTLPQGESPFVLGSGSQTTSNRWGDYSMMAIDPSDDCTFWYTQMYYTAAAGTNWQTRVGAFRFPSCVGLATPTPLSTATPLPTSTPQPPSPTFTACPADPDYQIFASVTGTLIPATDLVPNSQCDECRVTINFPFPVRFYDRTFTTATASDNGTLEFLSADGSPNNTCLPYSNFSYAIAAHWDDLRTDTAGGGIYTAVTGQAPNRIFTIEWRGRRFGGTDPVNFEIDMPENLSGNWFQIIYGQVDFGGLNATIGAQKNGTRFTQHQCNTGGIVPGTRLIFIMPCNPATPTPVPTSGILTPTATPTQQTGGCRITFADVPSGSAFYDFVRCLACQGIVGGYPCGGPGEPCDANNTPYFRPGANVTRGQIAKIVTIAAGLGSGPTNQMFTDVDAGHVFFSYVQSLAGLGYISGYACGGPGEPCGPGNLPYFRPGNNATRGQIAKIVVNAAGLSNPPPVQIFQDVTPGTSFYDFVQILAGNGYISGYACGGPGEPCGSTNMPYFRPNANATRGQLSKIVSNTFFPGCNIP